MPHQLGALYGSFLRRWAVPRQGPSSTLVFAAMPRFRVRSLVIATLALTTACFEDSDPQQGNTTIGDGSTGHEGTTGASSAGTPTGSPGSSGTSSPSPTTGANETDTTDGGANDTTGVGTTDDGTTDTSADPGPCPSFVDDFEDGVLGALWSTPYPAAISEQGGAAVISITPEAADQFARLMLSPPSGFIGASARLEVGTVPTEVGSQMLLWLTSGNDSGSIAMAINVTNDGTELNVTQDDGLGMPGSIVTVSSIPYDIASHQWLAVTEADGVLTFQTSADGTSFATFVDVSAEFDLEQAEVGVVGTNWGELPAPTQVSAESFEIDCAS